MGSFSISQNATVNSWRDQEKCPAASKGGRGFLTYRSKGWLVDRHFPSQLCKTTYLLMLRANYNSDPKKNDMILIWLEPEGTINARGLGSKNRLHFQCRNLIRTIALLRATNIKHFLFGLKNWMWMFQNIFPLSVISKSYSLTNLFYQDKLTVIYFSFHDKAILFFEAGNLLIMIMRAKNH